MSEAFDISDAVPAKRAWLRDLARLVAFCVGVGVVAGVAWYLIAPTPAFVARGGRLLYAKDLPGEYVAMDGWFATIGAVAGIVVAAVVLRRGPLGPWRIVAVPAIGLLGSCVAWRVGLGLGPETPSLPAGGVTAFSQVFHGQLDLTAKGVLLVWPVVSLAILTFALAWTSRDDQHPTEVSESASPFDDAVPVGADADRSELVGGDADLSDVDRG